MSNVNFEEVYKVACKAVLDAGKETLKVFPHIRKIKSKALANDVLTTADETSERIIVASIKRNFPEHHIFSEEMGSNNKISDFKWVIDPLDGSKHIIKGIPFFSITLGVIYKDDVILGITYIPKLDQFFEAQKGKGAFLNGKKISVSRIDKLDESILSAEFPSRNFKVSWSFKAYNRAFEEFSALLKNSFRVRMIGSGPIALAYTAMGGYDAYIRFQPFSLEDVIAGFLLVKEAGGTVTGFTGKDFSLLKKTGGKFIASNGSVHKEILKVIK